MSVRPSIAVVTFADPLKPDSKSSVNVTGIERISTGQDIEITLPIKDATSEAFESFAKQFSLDVVLERDALIVERDSLLVKIAHLETNQSFSPRIIDSGAFIDRLSRDELMTLNRSKDPTTVSIADTLDAYRVAHDPIHLDDPKFTTPMMYLVSTNVLTEDRCKELSRDATKAEAYFATPPTNP